MPNQQTSPHPWVLWLMHLCSLQITMITPNLNNSHKATQTTNKLSSILKIEKNYVHSQDNLMSELFMLKELSILLENNLRLETSKIKETLHCLLVGSPVILKSYSMCSFSFIHLACFKSPQRKVINENYYFSLSFWCSPTHVLIKTS